MRESQYRKKVLLKQVARPQTTCLIKYQEYVGPDLDMSTTDFVTVPPGVVCTVEEYNNSDAVTGGFHRHCLTRKQSLGLMVVIFCGIVSFVAVLCMFVFIIRNAMFYRRQKKEARGGSYYSLIEKPIDALLLSLFVSDMLQAIGTIMSIVWVTTGRTEAGDYCTAQGVVKQLSETSVAMITSVIALYTLSSWYRGIEGSLHRAVYVTVGVWMLVLFFVVLGNAQHPTNSAKPYSSPTPYWCWISSKHYHYQIIGEYLWMWITLFLSFIVYAILARQDVGIRNYQILVYPLVYAITILPLSVVRFIGFTRERQPIQTRTPMPSVATFIVASIFNLGGVFNVVLTYWLRKNSNLLHRKQLEPGVSVGLSMMPDGANTMMEISMVNGDDKERESSNMGFVQELPRERLSEGPPELKLNII